jgi:hypothetical protein
MLNPEFYDQSRIAECLIWHKLSPDPQAIRGIGPRSTVFCLRLVHGGRSLHRHEFRCQTSEGIFN